MDEILENYDYTINYYPGKVNVVADALSWKSQVVGLMIKKWDMLVSGILTWNAKRWFLELLRWNSLY